MSTQNQQYLPAYDEQMQEIGRELDFLFGWIRAFIRKEEE